MNTLYFGSEMSAEWKKERERRVMNLFFRAKTKGIRSRLQKQRKDADKGLKEFLTAYENLFSFVCLRCQG